MPASRPDASPEGDWRAGMFARPDVEARILPNGEIRVASRIAPSPRARTTMDWLARWANETPEAAFITEARAANGERESLSYGQAWQDAGRIGAGLLTEGFQPGDRLMVLAPNGINHMRIALAALRTGIVYVPVAPQYAARGADADKLNGVIDMIAPVAAYCDSVDAAPMLAGQVRLIEGVKRRSKGTPDRRRRGTPFSDNMMLVC